MFEQSLASQFIVSSLNTFLSSQILKNKQKKLNLKFINQMLTYDLFSAFSKLPTHVKGLYIKLNVAIIGPSTVCFSSQG